MTKKKYKRYRVQAARVETCERRFRTSVCEELGISPRQQINRLLGDEAFPGQGKSRDEELTKLKRELAKVKQERDFLRDAAVFFAKESNEIPMYRDAATNIREYDRLLESLFVLCDPGKLLATNLMGLRKVPRRTANPLSRTVTALLPKRPWLPHLGRDRVLDG